MLPVIEVSGRSWRFRSPSPLGTHGTDGAVTWSVGVRRRHWTSRVVQKPHGVHSLIHGHVHKLQFFIVQNWRKKSRLRSAVGRLPVGRSILQGRPLLSIKFYSQFRQKKENSLGSTDARAPVCRQTREAIRPPRSRSSRRPRQNPNGNDLQNSDGCLK